MQFWIIAEKFAAPSKIFHFMLVKESGQPIQVWRVFDIITPAIIILKPSLAIIIGAVAHVLVVVVSLLHYPVLLLLQ